MNEQSCVATVVENHVWADVRLSLCGRLCGPVEDAAGAPPVFLEGLALPSEYRHTLRVGDGSVRSNDYCGGGFILSAEDVARCPADLGAEGSQGFYQHGGLHGHVQRTGDASTSQWLACSKLRAKRHKSWHLVLSKANLVAAGFGKLQVGNLVFEV